MSSSISSSDAVPNRSFGAVFLLSIVLLTAATFGLLVALDPYDRGIGLFSHAGTLKRQPRLANVSRGRDPAFNAAIFGNSHAELLMPARLDAKTGLHFVQLTIPGSGPVEQFVALGWFLRNRPAPPAAIVIGVDDKWCAGTTDAPLSSPFPFWLYGSVSDYLRNIFRYDAVELLPRRIALLMGRWKPLSADGYLNYEPFYHGSHAQVASDLAQLAHTVIWPTVASYPFLDELKRDWKGIPTQTAVVLLIPPRVAGVLKSRSPEETLAIQRCKEAVQALAAQRPNTAVVDWNVVRPETENGYNFWDAQHYAMPVAQAIETDIAAALQKMGGG